MGQLTQNLALPVGSAIGEILEANPQSRNLLINASLMDANTQWVNVGGAVRTPINATELWDAGFYGQRMRSQNGSNDFVHNASVVALPATVYTVQAQFSVDPNFPSLAGLVLSTRCRLAINWTGGVARQDSVDINPANGQILAASAGVTNVQVTKFTAEQQGGTLVTMFTLAFTTPATPAATNAGDYQIFPRTDTAAAGANGSLVTGGWQVEASTFASSPIPTPNDSTVQRPIGAFPRQTMDLSMGPITTNSHTYAQGIEIGRTFLLTGGGANFTLPSLVHPPLASSDGEWCWIVNNSGGNATINATGGGFYGLDLAPATASIVLPYKGVQGMLCMFNANAGGAGVAGWQIMSTVTFTPGAATPANPANSIQFNNAGAFGGSANNTWTGTAQVLNALLDISGASGGQIKFPAAQNASADVNTLDDYEEGTWTPSVGGTATYTQQIGIYTKVGRQVTASFNMQINAIGTGSATTVSGLPFTSAGGLAKYGTSSWSANVTALVFNAWFNATGTTTFVGLGAAAATANLATQNMFGNGTFGATTCTYDTTT